MKPPHDFDFSKYIADRTRDFVGREWVCTAIDRWLVDPNVTRHFTIARDQ